MKAGSDSIEKQPSVKAQCNTQTPLHKSTKKIRQPLQSPRKNYMRSKGKQSSSEINTSINRKSTEGKEKIEPNGIHCTQKKEKNEVPLKKEKRCIEPTQKIVDRINANLQTLQTKIFQLFQEQIEEDGGFLGIQEKKSLQGEKVGVTSIVFKKQGSALSLSKSSSKKRLEGRVTHDGIRSDRKYGQMGKTSKVVAQRGWK